MSRQPASPRINSVPDEVSSEPAVAPSDAMSDCRILDREEPQRRLRSLICSPNKAGKT